MNSTMRFIALALLAGGIGGVLTLQRQTTRALTAEIERSHGREEELVRLRAENERLQQELVSPAELDRLRDDRAALPRLRAELEQLKRSQAGRISK
ncbi:MAG TPA: hypothetical protein VHD62_18375 [Opitutaceae bacterium]|nr:hypothetical protein [Opitutaceae bacterium]